MNMFSHGCVLFTGVLIASCAALAADESIEKKFKTRDEAAAYFILVDENKDGLITIEEWRKQGLGAEQFGKADTTKDGKVDQKEFIAQAFCC